MVLDLIIHTQILLVGSLNNHGMRFVDLMNCQGNIVYQKILGQVAFIGIVCLFMENAPDAMDSMKNIRGILYI